MKKVYVFSLLILLIITYESKSQVTTEWAEKICGNNSSYNTKSITDANGNSYIGGEFYSDTLYFNNGIFIVNNSHIGTSDAFLTKYDNSGLCQWAISFGGKYDEAVKDLDIDSEGNIYTMGEIQSDSTVINNGKVIYVLEDDNTTSYIAKFNNSGICQWAEKFTSKYISEAKKLSVNNSGEIYVTGDLLSGTINFNNNITLELPKINNFRVFGSFIANYDNNGNCIWAESVSGQPNSPDNIKTDNNDNIYLIGNYEHDEADLIFNNGITSSVYGDNNSYNVFIAKYNNSGECQWAQNIISPVNDFNAKLDVDSDGNIYIAGYIEFSSDEDTLFFNNNFYISNSANSDGYLAKYNGDGLCQWVQTIIGTNEFYSTGLSISSDNNIYYLGLTDSDSLSFNNGKYISNTNNVPWYGYFAKYNTNGECQWATRISQSGEDAPISLSQTPDGSIYLMGSFSNDTLYFDNDKYLASNENNYIYLAKFNPSSPLVLATISAPIQTNKVTYHSAVSGGEIISDGGASIIERGICISTSSLPDINDTKVVASTADIGNFSVKFEDLLPATKYYFRIYATNSVGTAYSIQRSFTTPPNN